MTWHFGACLHACRPQRSAMCADRCPVGLVRKEAELTMEEEGHVHSQKSWNDTVVFFICPLWASCLQSCLNDICLYAWHHLEHLNPALHFSFNDYYCFFFVQYCNKGPCLIRTWPEAEWAYNETLLASGQRGHKREKEKKNFILFNQASSLWWGLLSSRQRRPLSDSGPRPSTDSRNVLIID